MRALLLLFNGGGCCEAGCKPGARGRACGAGQRRKQRAQARSQSRRRLIRRDCLVTSGARAGVGSRGGSQDRQHMGPSEQHRTRPWACRARHCAPRPPGGAGARDSSAGGRAAGERSAA